MKYDYTCPYCWQCTDTLLDTSVREQTYVEDCQVCCHPIEIHYRFAEVEYDIEVDDMRLVCFEVRRENGGEWGS